MVFHLPGYPFINYKLKKKKRNKKCWNSSAGKTWIYLSWTFHDDVINWKHFPRYWPFVRGIHRSAVNSPHKGQWRGALLFFFICAWIKGWVNNREAGDLRRHRAHYDVIVMQCHGCCWRKAPGYQHLCYYFSSPEIFWPPHWRANYQNNLQKY